MSIDGAAPGRESGTSGFAVLSGVVTMARGSSAGAKPDDAGGSGAFELAGGTAGRLATGVLGGAAAARAGDDVERRRFSMPFDATGCASGTGAVGGPVVAERASVWGSRQAGETTSDAA